MRIVVALLGFLWVVGSATGAARPTPISKNLVKNAGAELGPATSDSAKSALPVPSWTVTGGFFAAAYNGYSWAPSPGDRTKGSGAKFFVGCFQELGQTVNAGTATQEVPLGRWTKSIDAGSAGLVFSADLGGSDGTVNRAVATVTFVDANGGTMGKRIRLVGPTYIQRQGNTRLEPRSRTGAVPKGARSMRVGLTGSRNGLGPCGYIDNVSAVLVRQG